MDSDREQPCHSDEAHERYQEAWARLPPDVIDYLEDQEIADPERIANAACPTTVGTNKEGNFTIIPAETNFATGMSASISGLTQGTREWAAVTTLHIRAKEVMDSTKHDPGTRGCFSD